MPRKPKREKKTITALVNGVPVAVILHPPGGRRTSWYAYWAGLVASKSTGQRTLEDAIVAAEHMVRNNGDRACMEDAILSDEEFEAIQRTYYGRKMDPAAQARAAKTLDDCLEAIDAFRQITGLKPITAATADHCAAFQRQGQEKPRNWRKQYPKGKTGGEVGRVQANTVLKWSRQLQAAWERANRTAGKKCVRGVVAEAKLLTENPWKQFTWVEGTERPIRQFDGQELLSLLVYLDAKWPGVTVAAALARLCLWSQGRRMEVAGLTWASFREAAGEYHFQVMGKWGVEKWFRVPEGLYQELVSFKTDSPYVFAAYAEQLRKCHEHGHRPGLAARVGTEFNPVNLGDWFHERLVDWSASLAKGHATTHIFRKTSLQYARTGEDVNRLVAADARVSPDVMMTHYVKESDEEMRQKSNRTFRRILASLPPEVASRYGSTASGRNQLQDKVKAAMAAQDWPLVAQLSSELAEQPQSTAG